LRVPALDPPDLTILGWTPTDDQWTAAVAVAIGAIAAVLLMAMWRRARKAVIAATLAVVLFVVWWRVLR
jgi:hypothetical protein